MKIHPLSLKMTASCILVHRDMRIWGDMIFFAAGWMPQAYGTAPENLRYPLNTTDDDLFYYPWHDARVVYASLIRPDGLGKEDIYAIQPTDDKALPELLADILKPVTITETTVMVQEEAAPAVPQPAESPSQPVQPVITPPAEPATVPPAVQPQHLSPKEIILKPVYFAFDNHQLTREGEDQLKVVYQLMKDYPVIRIKLIGHADAKGPAEYNLVLSERRASSSMKYLVNLGIESGRLSAVGIGEKNFVAINSNPDGTDNPEGRRLNRRVEYEITGSDDSVIRMIIPAVPDNLKFSQ